MSTDIKAIYQGSLTATRAAEQQGLQMMETQLPSLGDYPDYAALLQRHIAITKAQVTRIESAMADTGTSPSAIKEAFTSAVGTVGAAVHGMFPDTQLKNLYAGYAYQHEQIAAYQSLAVIAEQAGFAQHRAWIAQSLAEEREGATDAEELIEPVTRQYLALTTAV